MRTDLIERMTSAIYEASDFAIPPQMVDECSVAALKIVRDYFKEMAQASIFSEDRENCYGVVEELNDHLPSEAKAA